MQIATWLILFVAPVGWANRVQNIDDSHAVSDETIIPNPSTQHLLRQYDNQFDWKPRHDQIWVETNEPQKKQHYANWEDKRVIVYSPTQCSKEFVHWSVPHLNIEGDIQRTGPWTAIPIELPPFTNEVEVVISCLDHSNIITWNRTTSREIPQLYWKQGSNGSLDTLLHNGHGLVMEVSVRGHDDTDWIDFTRLHSTHPIEPWVLPLISVKDVRLQVRDGDDIIIDHTIQASSTDTASHTFSPNATFLLPMQNTQFVSVEAPNQTQTTLYSYQKLLEYTSSIVGLHWLQNQVSENSEIKPIWIYDGAWKWFAEPLWTNADGSASVEALGDFEAAAPIPFVRWTDTIIQETRHFTPNHMNKRAKPVAGRVELSDKYNLALSPEDQIQFQLDTQSLMSSNTSVNLSASITDISTRWMLSTDSRIPDARLLSLLPFTMIPRTPLTAAQTLHHVALFWNPLQSRSLPWFQSLLDAADQSLDYLESLSSDTWNTLDLETRLFIVWASLTADKEGLSPSSTLMRRNLDWLCTDLEAHHQDTQTLLSHVRWMVTQSYWRHKSCTLIDAPLAFDDNPLSSEAVQFVMTALQNAWENRSLTELPLDVPNWMMWILLEKEQEKQDRYANIKVKLQSNTQSTRGLFHEWQIRPIRHILDPNENWTLSAHGVGRLYIGLWRASNAVFTKSQAESLSVQREFYTDMGQPYDPLNSIIGQPVILKTTVETTPDTRFCIRQWNASGLAHNRTEEDHFCTHTDSSGVWTDITETHVVFDGRFRLPATMVATDTELAHTETVWFETQGYKELMSE